MAQDVVTGFIDGDQAHGRPVGVGIDGTGALLVADDAGNTVWRVAAADGSVTPQPIGTDRVASASETGPAPAGPAASGQATATSPEGAAPPEPSQTDIAPAVLPEGTVQAGQASQE